MMEEDLESKLKKYRPIEDAYKARQYLSRLCNGDRPTMSIPPDGDDWDMVFCRIISRCEELDDEGMIKGLMGTINSQGQTNDALIKKLRKYQEALRDTVQALDNCTSVIGREIKGNIMPKEQRQAYDVLQKHAEIIGQTK